MTKPLTPAEKTYLLKLARTSMEQAVRRGTLHYLDLSELSAALQAPGASFVTLTRSGALRGCLGTIEPYQPLAEDVREHAVAAALQDYRFPPVQASELGEIQLEISRLTIPQALEYSSAEDLLEKITPGRDGVILRDGIRRATYLPQVWQKVSGKEDFLDQLCFKMGAEPDLWRCKHLEVLLYQVEEFHE